MRDFAARFYKGRQWQACRESFVSSRIAADGGLCEICGERLGYIVHHRTELSPENINDPNITLSHSNLQYVCLECHNRLHGHFTAAGRRCVFDANGDVVGVI